MKICFIPIDNRPVCYNLAKDILAIDEIFELFIPPREFLGDLTKSANIEKIINWLKNCPACDAVIISLDTIAYGGLIPSRRSEETFEEIKTRIENLKQILQEKNAKIYAFSSIMRISNNNYNEEEKEYWKDYGKKIFDYSFSGGVNKTDIPQEVLNDYLKTRKRNFKINKLYLEWQKEGLFETLIFSKDDCAEFGFNVDEANELDYVHMGSYGIGIERCLSSIVEMNHDDKGIIWPMSVAPYKVAIVIVNVNDQETYKYALNLYNKLNTLGIDTILDDIKESVGVKFNDMDLLGIPIRVTVGSKYESGFVEFKLRNEANTKFIKVDNLIEKIQRAIEKQ